MKKTDILRQIDAAEAAYPRISDEKYRLRFHLMPPVGWLNDPNGLCVYHDTFHVFSSIHRKPRTAAAGNSGDITHRLTW